MEPPQGWYDDGTGNQRWWNGRQWTNQVAPPRVIVTSPMPSQFEVDPPRRGNTLAVVLVIVGLAFVGLIISVTIMVSNLSSGDDAQAPPTTEQSATPQAEPDETAEPSSTRMPVEEIATKTRELLLSDGLGNGYEQMPDFYPCLSKFLYESEMPDELLAKTVNGAMPEDLTEEEKELAGGVLSDAINTCDPDGQGAWG